MEEEEYGDDFDVQGTMEGVRDHSYSEGGFEDNSAHNSAENFASVNKESSAEYDADFDDDNDLSPKVAVSAQKINSSPLSANLFHAASFKAQSGFRLLPAEEPLRPAHLDTQSKTLQQDAQDTYGDDFEDDESEHNYYTEPNDRDEPENASQQGSAAAISQEQGDIEHPAENTHEDDVKCPSIDRDQMNRHIPTDNERSVSDETSARESAVGHNNWAESLEGSYDTDNGAGIAGRNMVLNLDIPQWTNNQVTLDIPHWNREDVAVSAGNSNDGKDDNEEDERSDEFNNDEGTAQKSAEAEPEDAADEVQDDEEIVGEKEKVEEEINSAAKQEIEEEEIEEAEVVEPYEERFNSDPAAEESNLADGENPPSAELVDEDDNGDDKDRSNHFPPHLSSESEAFSGEGDEYDQIRDDKVLEDSQSVHEADQSGERGNEDFEASDHDTRDQTEADLGNNEPICVDERANSDEAQSEEELLKDSAALGSPLHKSVFTIQEVSLAELPLDFTELREFYLKFQLGSWSESSSVLLSNQSLVWPAINIVCDVTLMDGNVTWCPAGAEDRGQADMEIVVMENTANEGQTLFAVGLLRLDDIVRAVRSDQPTSMEIQLSDSSKTAIGVALITMSTDSDFINAAVSLQEPSLSVQEKSSEEWNGKVPDTYGDDFEQSSELLASRLSKAESIAWKDEEVKIEPGGDETVFDTAETDNAQLIDSDAVNAENLDLEDASYSKDDKSRVASPHAVEDAPLTEASAMYGADFDESTNDLSRKDGIVSVSVDLQQEESKLTEAVVDAAVTELTDGRVPEDQLSIAISGSHQNLQEGPESEPSPDLKPSVDPSSGVAANLVSDPIPNLASEPNPSNDSTLAPNPNPKQSKVLQSLREQVSNSRKHNSDAVGGRRPPVPKLSVLSVPGCNFTPAPTKEEVDAEAMKMRKIRMKARPWRDVPVTITKKDLLVQKRGGQVAAPSGAMGSLEREEEYELQMHISKYCCHKILLSKCKEQGCKDAYDKFKWLKYLYHKQKVVVDIVEEADRLWRKKLHKSLEKALVDLKADHDQEKKDVHAKMDEKSRAEQAIFDTLQHYSEVEKKVIRQVHDHYAAKDAAAQAQYKELVEKGIEGNLSAKIQIPKQLLNSDVYYKTIDREVFNSSGGLTKDHCEYLRRRLASCISHREERYKDFIHATKGIHEKQIEDMKDSISGPLKYLDRIKTTQVESLRLLVMRVESSFKHSMMLSMVKREVANNEVAREKALHASQMAFKTLKQSLAGIAKICAELPAIYTGITLTDYHNAMADMIKQIRPPTSSPTRQRRDALSPPKQKARRKKGKKKKSAKEVSGDEGANLPSAGDGVRVRPSTAKPVAQKDGREIRRVKSANNNVHASSWVMSTEDENALDDDDDDDDDVEQDIELDEARDTLHPLMKDVVGVLPHGSGDREFDSAPSSPQRREKGKDVDTSFDSPSPKPLPKNKSSNSLFSFASHSHSDYSQIYEEEDESLYGDDFDEARKTLSHVESEVFNNPGGTTTLTRDASIQSFVSGIMEEAMSIVASPSRPNLSATSEIVPEEINLRSEETREFKSIMSIISNAINSDGNEIIEDNLPSQIAEAGPFPDKVESFAMTNESNRYDDDFAVESASKKTNHYSSEFTHESSNPNLYEDDFVPDQSKIRSQILYEDDFLPNEQDEDDENDDDDDDAGRGEGEGEGGVILPGEGLGGKNGERKRLSRERRSREVWRLIAAEGDAECQPNLSTAKERKKNMRGVIDGLVENYRRRKEDQEKGPKGKKAKKDAKSNSSMSNRGGPNPNPNPNPNPQGEMNWVVETIDSDEEEPLRQGPDEETDKYTEEANNPLMRPASRISSKSRRKLLGKIPQQLCHFCGDRFDGEGHALPNTISEDIRIRKIVRRRLNQKYPVDIEGLMIPPTSPEHPKIDKKTLSQRKQLEELEDQAFVTELITKKPFNVKILQNKGEPDRAKESMMIKTQKEDSFVTNIRSLSKQYSFPEKTNEEVKSGLLLVSLDQIRPNVTGTKNLLEDLQSLMILSSGHMPSAKQQPKKKNRRKNEFLDDKPPRLMPMTSISFSYNADSEDPKLLGLHIVRSPNASEAGIGSLREALVSDRRITSKNIVKWSQQLSESLWKIHLSYITLGDFDLDDIFLVSDVHFERILEQNQGSSPSPGKGGETGVHGTEDSRRNAWIDLFLIFRRKIATYTSLQSPKISIPILDDASSAMSSIVPSSLSISSSVRQPSSLSSSSVSSSRRTVQAHSSPLLLRLDKNKKAEVPLRRSESVFEEVRVAYSQWCRQVQRDCRKLGILLLQLIAHRIFSSREVRELKDLVVELPADEVATKAVARVSRDDGNSDDSSGTEGDNNDEILFHVARELQRRYALVSGMPVEVQQLLSVCFAPKEDMEIKGTHADNKNSMAKFTFDFMRKFGDALADLTELAEEHAEIVNYVKPVYWTEADEKERLEKKEKVRLEMQKKAESATDAAIERVRVERYKLWFSNQPEDYQREFHRKKAAKARTNANIKERKHFIHKALFHTWSWDDFSPWLHKTILGYLLRVLSWKVAEDERARLGGRNPNPNSAANKKEKSQKNLKLESILQTITKEDSSDSAKKGTELYIQMQIDDLVDTISPFVIQKLRDLAAAEAEATQVVALAASSLKSGVSGLQISRQQSFSQGSSWSSATLPYLSPERPPSRGLSNSQLLLNTQRSRLDTARSGQMSRPTTQSKTQLELNEESVRSFVDRLVPILQSYFKYPVQITKPLRESVSEEVPLTDELVANLKLLVTSPAQLLHRRMVCRADLLTTKYCKMIRKACGELCGITKIMDRSYARKFGGIISLAIFYQYHEEQDMRLKGENFAASKLTSFFQSIRIKKIVQHIWHQVNEQLSHDSRHPNHRPRSRAVSEHDPDKADNLTSTANTLKSAAAVERKDKSGWIAQARPPMDVEWTVDRDDLVSVTFEFNNCGRESLATWKKVRCFGYESRHPNLNQSSGATSQMVFSLKTFLNMQSDDFESKPTEFLPLVLRSFSVRSSSSGHVVFTASIDCQRLSRQARFALTVALDVDLTALLKSRHAVYFKQKCDASITGGRVGHFPPTTAVHKCSVHWAIVQPMRISGHAKSLGENLLFMTNQLLSLPGAIPVRLPAPHLQLSLSSSFPKEETETEMGIDTESKKGISLPSPALLLFDLSTRGDARDFEGNANESSPERERVQVHSLARIWASARLSWGHSEEDQPQRTTYETQRRLVLLLTRRDRSGLPASEQQQHQYLQWKGQWHSTGVQESPHLYESCLVWGETPPSTSPRRRRNICLTEFRQKILSLLKKYAVEILQHPVTHTGPQPAGLSAEEGGDEILDTGIALFLQYQVRAINSAGRGPYSPPAVALLSSSSSRSHIHSFSGARTEQDINGGKLAHLVVRRSQLLASLASATAKDEVRSELIRSIISAANSLSDRFDDQRRPEPAGEVEEGDTECREAVMQAAVVSPEEEWLAKLPDFCPF